VVRQDLAPGDWDALVEQARDAKERLSPQSRRIGLDVPGAGPGLVSVTVADYYAAVAPLVEQSIAAMQPLVRKRWPS
jgi:hypothetical protein